ncbi:SPOR domain-containing protein [Tardiphaga sp. 709]|uniref:SPOR domain-containing protein n=1 Tax=unclassified Tardiphaga TaxID=2631404 RepID=UPI0028E2C5CF|nr:SPOR domain-containing protein [Tardiphaga sp. 709]WNV09748.1 SPOR domain-containing protein [Tardiphaga sp. 709]
MANRYQNRPFPADDDYGRDAQSRTKGEGDPLAELARLIGQTDPFASNGRPAPAPRQAEPAYQDEPEYQEEPAQPGPPPWMQRAAAHEPQQQEFENLHPVQRYGAQHQEPQHLQPEADYHQAPAFAAHTDHQAQDYQGQYDQAHVPHDPNRYDDALYGHADGARAQHPHDDQYQDDPYAYQDGYAEQEEAPKRRGGMATVAIVLALAVVGTGAAFGYRTFMGSARTGEPPVIKAEPGPNKIVPPSATAAADGKPIQDRLGGAAPERLVSREEQPVNVQDATKAGPRVVFPPLNQNANPPSTASVSPSNKPMVGNGAMQGGDEPRKIRTFAVKGDQSDAGATPAARQAPARIAAPAAVPAAAPAAAPRATNANASANAPMSLSPQAAPPAAAAPPAPSPRMASTNPTQQAAPVASGGGYVVQVSSQRSEGDAQASFRALQTKFPSVLGSRAPLIKKADLGDKGTYYRAMVGPFSSQDEASQVCGNLKSAGGQCVVQRN